MLHAVLQWQNRCSSLTSIHVQADMHLLVVRQHRQGQDAMFSCTSHSKAFRKWHFQGMTFNASATNNSGLEQATVVIPSEFVVEWSNYLPISELTGNGENTHRSSIYTRTKNCKTTPDGRFSLRGSQMFHTEHAMEFEQRFYRYTQRHHLE